MNIPTEQIDDFPLLLEFMQRLGLPASLDHIRVYELKPEQVRLDATTVSGYPVSGEKTLFQC